MKKSERLRLLELDFIRMQYEMHELTQLVNYLIQLNKSTYPTLDSDKWYMDNFPKND